MRDTSYGHAYDSSDSHHIESDPHCRIQCETVHAADGTTYPLLHVGRVTFYPSAAQLRLLEAALRGWRLGGATCDDGTRPPIRQAAPTDATDRAELCVEGRS